MLSRPLPMCPRTLCLGSSVPWTTRPLDDASLALQRKSYLWIPFLGIARPQSQFHIHVSVSAFYIPRIGPHISCSRIGRSIVWVYKFLTDTYECGNWDFGRAILFLGIFVSTFRHWFFAEWTMRPLDDTLTLMIIKSMLSIHLKSLRSCWACG